MVQSFCSSKPVCYFAVDHQRDQLLLSKYLKEASKYVLPKAGHKKVSTNMFVSSSIRVSPNISVCRTSLQLLVFLHVTHTPQRN